jgi:hypothetical protein
MIGVFVCLFTLTSVPFQPARPVEAAPPSIADELLGDWLPQPGNQSTPSPFGPNRSEQEEPDVPSLGDHGANSEADEGQPEDPVLLPSGSLTFIEQDIEWEAPGFPITLQRMFSSERNEAGGAFGAGWSHPYEHRLTMYADFDIVEIRP